MRLPTLTDADRQAWSRDHFLVVPDALAPPELAALRATVEDFAARPETPGKWMKYFEQGDVSARQLCRVEDVLPYDTWLRELLTGDEVLAFLAGVLGEPAVLYKEKINYKLAGGAGFAAHQDAPAFATLGQSYHVTVLLAVDACTVTNGCLEVAPSPEVGTVLPQAPGGHLHPDTEAALPWRPLELPAGALAVFDSFVPHRSAPNASGGPRRIVLATYARAAEGDRRAAYFADKRASFPPEIEREAGVDYGAANNPYNLGNPIV